MFKIEILSAAGRYIVHFTDSCSLRHSRRSSQHKNTVRSQEPLRAGRQEEVGEK